MRRLMASAAAAAVLLASLPAAAQTPMLTDIDGHWARTAILEGVGAGYISGYPDRTFRPNENVNRSEFIKILTAALHLPPAAVDTGFIEQLTTHWAFSSGYVQSAVSGGILVPADYGEHYGPDLPITRREIIMAAVRALGKEAAAKGQSWSVTTPDANQIPPWLQGYAAVAMNEGILKGLDDGTLGLERQATRAEAVMIVQRILSRVKMTVAPWSGPASATAIRHPGEGEPWWQVRENQTVLMGEQAAYTVPVPALGVQLMPVQGKATWIKYVDGQEAVIGYLAQSTFTEVARGELHMLLHDDEGRLWATDGTELVRFDRGGRRQSFPQVTERVRRAAMDWNGTVYGFGETKLFMVDPSGGVTAYELPLSGVQHVTVSEDGAVWFIATDGNSGERLVAYKVVDGVVEREVPLLGSFAPVPGPVLAVGRSGPFAWYSIDGTLYRFDTNDGSFMRLLPPGDGYQPMLSPDGGVRVVDTAGVFWRVLP